MKTSHIRLGLALAYKWWASEASSLLVHTIHTLQKPNCCFSKTTWLL